MSGLTYYQRNREVILNRPKDYYRNNRDELKVKAKNKYRELSEEEKDIKRPYGKDRYNNMREEDKQRLKEYQRNFVGLDKYIKMESKVLSYDETSINKNAFYKTATSINIDRR